MISALFFVFIFKSKNQIVRCVKAFHFFIAKTHIGVLFYTAADDTSVYRIVAPIAANSFALAKANGTFCKKDPVVCNKANLLNDISAPHKTDIIDVARYFISAIIAEVN